MVGSDNTRLARCVENLIALTNATGVVKATVSPAVWEIAKVWPCVDVDVHHAVIRTAFAGVRVEVRATKRRDPTVAEVDGVSVECPNAQGEHESFPAKGWDWRDELEELL
jgi:hypothetical protein